MINKYIELHEQLMNLICRYHNMHIRFLNRPTVHTERDLITLTMELGKLVREIKKNNLEMRKKMQQQVYEKKRLIAAKKEEKRLRKLQNDNNK
jgi:hypothetical protein